MCATIVLDFTHMPISSVTKLFRKNKVIYEGKDLLSRIVTGYVDIKSKTTFDRIAKFIKGKKLLDVGVGAGGISKFLTKKGFFVSGLDIADVALFEGTNVRVYNGSDFPFKDNSFETALIVHVLHHCADSLRVLEEAKRVANRVIIIEDTYRNIFEKLIVSISDCLGNWEFYIHPYHTAEWWRNLVAKKGWNLVHMESYSELTYNYLYGRYVLFVIE